MPESAYIALGSNQGDQEQNLRLAATALRRLAVGKMMGSSIWWTKPEGFSGPVPDFCNAVVRLDVALTPAALLAEMKQIERDLGRLRDAAVAYQPRTYLSRTLDLDIIDFGQQQLDTDHLVLPHPRGHLRRFVLLPIQELDAGFRFPGIDKSLASLIDQAPENRMRKSSPLIPLD